MSFCYFPILATCRVRNSYTILDCVYSDTNGIFYILDMMCWDGYQVNIASICHTYDMTSLSLQNFVFSIVLSFETVSSPQYYDCDTEFRLAWVQQKFIENQVNLHFKAPTIAFSL